MWREISGQQVDERSIADVEKKTRKKQYISWQKLIVCTGMERY